MSDCNNSFDLFIQKFYIRYGKLLIEGFHNKAITQSRIIKSVSPTHRQRLNNNLFNVNPRIKNAYGLAPIEETHK
jgi:hypothetical protein